VIRPRSPSWLGLCRLRPMASSWLRPERWRRVSTRGRTELGGPSISIEQGFGGPLLRSMQARPAKGGG